jgi:membrane-associated phospholipid phosphatase
MAAMPYRADAHLAWIDERLCGRSPSLFLEAYQAPAWVELFSCVYAAFIPLNVTFIALHGLRHSPFQRQQFLSGLVLTYVLSHLGFLFLPAHGPVWFHAPDYRFPLSGGVVHRLVQWGTAASGGCLGVFPSLHVGSSAYLCLFHLQSRPCYGLAWAPFLVLTCLATVFLRYHYVTDVLAGAAIAVAALGLSRCLSRYQTGDRWGYQPGS